MDREIQVIVPMQASDVERGRRCIAAVAEFITIAWNYAGKIEQIMLSDDPDPSDWKKLVQLVAGLKSVAELAEEAKRVLAPLLKRATIHDPEGHKDRLQ